jgi:hypothetical protein
MTLAGWINSACAFAYIAAATSPHPHLSSFPIFGRGGIRLDNVEAFPRGTTKILRPSKKSCVEAPEAAAGNTARCATPDQFPHTFSRAGSISSIKDRTSR